MKAPRFAKLFAQLPFLNQPQRLAVLEALHPAAGRDRVIALIDEIRTPGRRCPRCDSDHLHRHGHVNDRHMWTANSRRGYIGAGRSV